MTTRRTLIKSGLGALAVGGAPLLQGCAATAAPVVASAAEAAAPTAAGLASWFSSVTSGVAASLIADSFKEVFKSGWEAFQEPTTAAISKQVDSGYTWFTTKVWGHEVPQASFVACHKAEAGDPATDRLLVTHTDGGQVVFESWAWRGVLAFIEKVSEKKKGDDLIHVQQLLAKTVLPHGPATSSGVTKNGTAAWVTYPARDGEVEVVTVKTEGAPNKVTVATTGFFSGSYGKSTLKTFQLDH